MKNLQSSITFMEQMEKVTIKQENEKDWCADDYLMVEIATPNTTHNNKDCNDKIGFIAAFIIRWWNMGGGKKIVETLNLLLKYHLKHANN